MPRAVGWGRHVLHDCVCGVTGVELRNEQPSTIRAAPRGHVASPRVEDSPVEAYLNSQLLHRHRILRAVDLLDRHPINTKGDAGGQDAAWGIWTREHDAAH